MKLAQRQLDSSVEAILLLIIGLALDAPVAFGVAPTVHVPEKLLYAGDELVVRCEERGALATDLQARKHIRYQFFVNDDFAGISKIYEDALKIKRASQEDHAGSWSCQTVVPKTGETSERSPAKTLTIVDVPLQPTLTLSQNRVNDLKKVTFACIVSQDSDAATSFSFHVNNSLYFTPKEPSFIRSVMQEEHQGKWSCRAHNKAGESPTSEAVALHVTVGRCNCRQICSQAEAAWKDFKPTLQIIAGAAAAGGAALGVPYLLGAVGFGAAGIGAGTVAAKLMALLGTGGAIIPALQSMGAAGLAWTTVFSFSGAGALFVALYKKMQSCNCLCEF